MPVKAAAVVGLPLAGWSGYRRCCSPGT